MVVREKNNRVFANDLEELRKEKMHKIEYPRLEVTFV